MPDERPHCAFCRRNRGDAFLHDDLNANAWRCGVYWVICFDCIEKMFERENALGQHGSARDGLHRVFGEDGEQIETLDLAEALPDLWDKPPRVVRRHLTGDEAREYNEIRQRQNEGRENHG